MPKAAESTVKDLGNGWEEVTSQVGQPDGTSKPATYRRPNLTVLTEMLVDGDKKYVPSVFFPGSDDKKSDETISQFIHRMFLNAIDRSAKQAAYVQAAQESTFITVGRERKNILDFPIENIVMAINGMRSQVSTRTMMAGGGADALEAAEKSVGYGPWKTAARKLVEAGKAKENTASKMLELVS